MSSTGPRDIGPSGLVALRMGCLDRAGFRIRHEAAELGLWTVFGAVHPLSPPHRPHSSLYVVSDRGALVTRYDERMLSATKITFMYAPGRLPITFEVDGLRFGCTLGMEAHYPEIFTAYEALDVDCVLFSTTGEPSPNASSFAAEVLGARLSQFVLGELRRPLRLERCRTIGDCRARRPLGGPFPADGEPSLTTAEVSIVTAHPARPWRRSARSGIYDAHLVDGDPKSETRDRF